METLSDLVFGLALSVGALALVAQPPTSVGALYTHLTAFGFSFVILILVWLSYTRIMAVHAAEDRRTIVLNAALLFSVSIEPFLFNLLFGANQGSVFIGAVSQAYSLDLGVMIGVLGLFSWDLAIGRRPSLAPAVQHSLRREAGARWLVAGIYAVSAAPIFFQPLVFTQPVRIWIWAIGLGVLFWARGRAPNLEEP